MREVTKRNPPRVRAGRASGAGTLRCSRSAGRCATRTSLCSDMLLSLRSLRSSALPRPHFPSTRLPAWISERFGLIDLRAGGYGSKATAKAKPQPGRSRRPRSGPRDRHCPMTFLLRLLTLRSRLWPSTSNQKLASKTRQEAGSKEPGAPRERRGAELDQGESEHVRAQGRASCAAALSQRAPQGTPCARRTRGADAGCPFSWLLLFDHSKRSNSAARPKRCRS